MHMISLLLAFASASAGAQTTSQWSQPTTTERWSEAPAPNPPAEAPKTEIWSSPSTTERWSEAPAPGPATPQPQGNQTQIWSSPTYTKQVDPRLIEEPEALADAGPIEAGLAGAWELWVPSGIWYSSDASRIYRNFTPGASMNRLMIGRDGAYQWNGHRGRLAEIRPWFAKEGQRYFAVQMDAKNKYMATLDPADGKLKLLFWGVGGHAATGERR